MLKEKAGGAGFVEERRLLPKGAVEEMEPDSEKAAW